MGADRDAVRGSEEMAIGLPVVRGPAEGPGPRPRVAREAWSTTVDPEDRVGRPTGLTRPGLTSDPCTLAPGEGTPAAGP